MTVFKDLWKTVKQIRHKRPQPVFCPKCKGHNIYPVHFGLLPAKYRCQDCEYEGSLILEVEDEERER